MFARERVAWRIALLLLAVGGCRENTPTTWETAEYRAWLARYRPSVATQPAGGNLVNVALLFSFSERDSPVYVHVLVADSGVDGLVEITPSRGAIPTGGILECKLALGLHDVELWLVNPKSGENFGARCRIDPSHGRYFEFTGLVPGTTPFVQYVVPPLRR